MTVALRVGHKATCPDNGGPMEAIKNELLSGTAPAPDPKPGKKKGRSKVEEGIEQDQSRLKPFAPEARSFRAHNAPHEHRQRHGDRGDDADGDDGEDVGAYRLRGRKLLTRHLCARYRVSDRTIDRWMRDPRLGFPQPTIVNRRRYWDENDVDQFDAKQREAVK